MKKRIIGVLLCVAMVCTLLPLNAFAADGNILHYDYNDGTFEGKTFVDENPDTASGKYHYIIDTVPVREGYVFNGWNTEKDGSGDSYSYGDIYYFEDIGACYDTVYAQWKLHNWIDYADTSWYDSDPEATSYTISTAEQLAGVAKLTSTEYLAFSGQTITLAGDISLDGKEWTPIGGFNTFANRGFYGTFDGAGYTISGLFIDASTDCQGLFGEAIKATVKNLKVSGSVSGNIFVAGIVASAYDTVIENCVNDCVLFGKEYVGGIAGTNRSSLITDCCNIAEINANPSYNNPSRVGGIVGYNAGFVSN